MKLSWRARIAAVIATTLTLTAVGALPAAAHNTAMGNSQWGCVVNSTDNANLSMYYGAAVMPSTAMSNGMLTYRGDLNTTDIDTFGYPDWDGSLAQRDIIGYNADYSGTTCGQAWFSESSPGMVGLEFCEGLNGVNCEQSRVYFDSDYIGISTANGLRAIACHEVGHAIGLTHTGGTCMTDPIDEGQVWYSADQIGHINARY